MGEVVTAPGVEPTFVVLLSGLAIKLPLNIYAYYHRPGFSQRWSERLLSAVGSSQCKSA